MVYPEDILKEGRVDPIMATEYVLNLERKYILAGKSWCHHKIYRAALIAIATVKIMCDDEKVLNAANSFLLNIQLKTLGNAQPKKEVVAELLQERDRLVCMPPAANRPSVYEVSMPLQTKITPRGFLIGLYTTMQNAERAVRNCVKRPPVDLMEYDKEIVYYIITQEAIDCYNLSPTDNCISVKKYNVDGELLSEWLNSRYNANGTIKCYSE